jgi:hypothetical protein
MGSFRDLRRVVAGLVWFRPLSRCYSGPRFDPVTIGFTVVVVSTLEFSCRWSALRVAGRCRHVCELSEARRHGPAVYGPR